MPGYQGAIVLRKTIVSVLNRATLRETYLKCSVFKQNTQLGNCESGNPLKYYDDYTYPACRVEHNLVRAAQYCGCKPYTLPSLRKGLIRSSAGG